VCGSYSKPLNKEGLPDFRGILSGARFSFPTTEAQAENRYGETVLVADDSVWVREGLRRLFDSAEGFEVCGEARNGARELRKPKSYSLT